ncbi:MFS transporter [Micromonospora yasonensis]|uniref:MFS transporter n=1 Tax=Micromonospora yasonensis TaxID=1128667 RepID=UPI0022316C4F|nr:MFS transporter [Micromonospora yasonensis]MCW3844600.1 MFS transporter [Micromonospora yasonensis]
MADQPSRRSPWFLLVLLCLAVFTINVDTTIVNVALPTFVRELHTDTRELQWIVDAYNLAFAALVLAFGSLGDRFGRRGMLVAGLALFTLATTVGAVVGTADHLIAVRAVMGVGAAMIYPTTLSILTNVFTERGPRAVAIGIWGGVTGLGVAVGPIVGGWLLAHFWWGSVFLAMAPPAALAAALTVAIVPTSRDPATPPLDVPGLALSSLAVGALVWTLIEAPDQGWGSARSVAGWLLAALLATALVLRERRVAHPMIDVRLFTNLRFSAASGAVTVAFFNLFGFIFLITQYFQFLRAYSAFETGVRLTPVAVCIAGGSVLGTRLAVRVGTRRVVAAGLLLLGLAYAWISTLSSTTGYPEIAAQMVLLGGGLGLTSAPATEAVMGVVPAAKAGIGSAVNDATRQVGGTLGVAVIGSIFASLYQHGLTRLDGELPPAAAATARDSIGAALTTADQLAATGLPAQASTLASAASAAFYDGLQAGCLVAAVISTLAAIGVIRLLPDHPSSPGNGQGFSDGRAGDGTPTPIHA